MNTIQRSAERLQRRAGLTGPSGRIVPVHVQAFPTYMNQSKVKKINERINNLQKQIKSNINKKQQQRRKGNRPKGRLQNLSRSSAYGKMLMDPCGATMAQGFYGSSQGYLSRFKSIVTSGFSGVAELIKSYGYFIWFPDYTNSGNNSPTGGTACVWNACYWNSASANTVPTEVNFGSDDVTGNTAHGVTDPAWIFLSGDTASDLRTIGACVRMSYTGKQVDYSGQVYPLSNIPLQFITGGVGANPPSVAAMLPYCNQGKSGINNMEVRHRPQVNSSTPFKDDTQNLYLTTVGSSPVYTEGTGSMGPTGIGFLWYGTRDPAHDFVIELFKQIEWRPEIASGLTMQPPKGADNPGRLSQVITSLDRKFPGWQEKATDSAIQMTANAISMMAVGGLRGAVGTPGRRSIEWGM